MQLIENTEMRAVPIGEKLYEAFRGIYTMTRNTL